MVLILVESPAVGEKSVPTQVLKCDGEILSYPVSALQVQVSPSYHLLGAQSPLKGSGTFKDSLLSTI